MSAAPGRTPPWSLADARTAFLPVALGGVVLGWTWWESSGTGKLDEQTTAVVFAVLGAAVCVAGCFAWVAAGRRAVHERRVVVIGALELELERSPRGASVTADTEHDGVVGVAGTSRYHRPGCLLVRGKAVEPGATSGRTACEMCRP